MTGVVVMQTGGQFATLLTTALGLITIVATGLAALLLGTLKTLRETNGDLRDQNGDLKSRNVELEANLARESEEKRVLAELVTGEAHLTRIEDLVEDQSSQLGAHHHESMQNLGSIAEALRNLTEQLRTRP